MQVPKEEKNLVYSGNLECEGKEAGLVGRHRPCKAW